MRILAVFSWILVSLLVLTSVSQAAESEVDKLLDLLVAKGVVSKEDATGFRAELAVKKQEDVASYKVSAVPEWTEKIKWSGDVRFRSRGDWGKTRTGSGAPVGSTGTLLKNQRLQNSVRGRFALEAKVNDFTYAGARFAGGTSSRSTDDTLAGYFNRSNATFDQYYIRFEASKDLVINYGKYFKDLKLWVGKFTNPFEYTEMTWDQDISPGGAALQYTSPDIRARNLPGFNVYSNLGFFWIDESATYNTDPLLFGYQIGARTEPFGPLRSTLGVSTAIYDFANLKNKTPNANSAGTNSRVWTGDGVVSSSPSAGTWKYEYNVFDLLVTVDNERIGDYAFPHGFVFDFIYNASVHGAIDNKGLDIGAYIGKKKLKDVGDWKVRADWRYIERDAIPDFLPDNNFAGFGTYVNSATRPNINGIAALGGTNGKGVRFGLEYQILKNTAFNISYFWMKPIKSWDITAPYNEVLVDIVTKF